MQGRSTAALVIDVAEADAMRDPTASLPRILFVCTANRCRSPLAEHLMRRTLHAAGMDALVASAGLLPGGTPTPPSGVRVAAANGLDLRSHRSVRVGSRLIEASDVILTMTREHAREVVALSPEAWPRAYPLKQFTDLLKHVTLPRRAFFRDATAAVGDGRTRKEILGNPDFDAVIDPMGKPAPVWQAVIDDLQHHVDLFVRSFATLTRRGG